jgi:PEP-CTERM motif
VLEHRRRLRYPLLIGAVIAIFGNLTALTPARAGGMSYTGTFSVDNDVELISFALSTTSDVTIETWSYAGGTNFVGDVIPAGGFDTIVTLFDPSGNFINYNDDGSGVATDPVTGAAFDSLLQMSALAPGTYTVALTQFDNFANGPTLGDGFSESGNPNFTLNFAPSGSSGFFWDVTENERTGNWALDIITSNTVPEPSALLLGGLGLIGAFTFARQRRPKSAVE